MVENLLFMLPHSTRTHVLREGYGPYLKQLYKPFLLFKGLKCVKNREVVDFPQHYERKKII